MAKMSQALHDPERPPLAETMPLLPDRLADHLSPASLRFHAGRAFRYGLVGGAGLALDLTLFLVLVHARFSPFAANIVSSATALTFVYAVSVRRVFRYGGRFIVPLFAAYVFYHVCGTLLVSWVISRLVQEGAGPALAKIAVLPLTFGANYAFMSLLTRRRERWVSEH